VFWIESLRSDNSSNVNSRDGNLCFVSGVAGAEPPTAPLLTGGYLRQGWTPFSSSSTLPVLRLLPLLSPVRRDPMGETPRSVARATLGQKGRGQGGYCCAVQATLKQQTGA
jgi:hypothetical protein